jgi:sialate O-acetylesterase
MVINKMTLRREKTDMSIGMNGKAPETLRLPRLISDGMVLQRGLPLDIWGWAAPGLQVTVRFLNGTYQGAADKNGKWRITLPALEAGGPYTMEIEADRSISVRDILIGDVWVCAGQSNMQLTLERVKDKYPEEVADCVHPWLRMFLVPQVYDFKGEHDDFESGNWITPGPDNILQFTAVGFFFAKELHEKYGVPIGLLSTAIGGTPAEAWMSAAALKPFPRLLETAEPYKDDAYLASVIKQNEKEMACWFNELNAADMGSNESTPWQDPDLDTSDWGAIRLPSFWADEGVGHVNGVLWFRKEIEVTPAMTGKPARIQLGCIVDSDTVYINGQFVGSISYRYPPRKYDIPADILKPGRNVVAVRVVSCVGDGGFVADKPYEIVAGGERVALDGLWQYKLGAAAPPMPAQIFVANLPTGYFNGMLPPLFNVRIKGVIWYQGESNTHDPGSYEGLFKALIAEWRQRWGQGDLPFLYVQLPNFEDVPDPVLGSTWALLREAQLKTLSVPDTAMAVAIDLGEYNDLHPLDKKNVAHRLALGARYIAYGERDLVFSGPLFRSASVQDAEAVITFDHIGGGLVTRDGAAPGGFELAGPDGGFVPAQARIDGNTVRVSCESVKVPTAVRYAWADNPEGANLYNAEGLPASPFRAVLSKMRI